MKNITRHTGTLEIIKRLPSSFFGNPRYEVRVDGFKAVTQVDSMISYGITNDEGKTVTATIGTHYNRPTINSIDRV